MELSVTELPSALELEDFTGRVTMVPDPSGILIESNIVITNATTSIIDSGVSLDFNTAPSELVISGRYEQQFSNTIRYKEPQVDEYTPSVTVTVNSWGEMPDPSDPSIWFIFAWVPPTVLNKVVTYTIDASWDEEDTAAPGVITQKTGTFSATQLVVYDSDSNILEFKRYT